jgi:hypothetical protein
VKNILCKLFGHKWAYHLSNITNRIDLRVCGGCGGVEIWRENVPSFGSNWFRTCEYTKKGGKERKEYLENNKIKGSK